MHLYILQICHTSVEHEELEDLSLGHSVENIKTTKNLWTNNKLQCLVFDNTGYCSVFLDTHEDTHPLHPRMLEDLSRTEAQGCIPNQQLGYEILGPTGDVSPVLVWKLILALLDALKQVTLKRVYYTISRETALLWVYL